MSSSTDSKAEDAAADSPSHPDPLPASDGGASLEQTSSELPISADPQLDEEEAVDAGVSASISSPDVTAIAGAEAGNLSKQPVTSMLSGLGFASSTQAKAGSSSEILTAEAAQEAARSALSMFSFGFGAKKEAEKIPLVEADTHMNAGAAAAALASNRPGSDAALLPTQSAFGNFGLRLLDMRNNAVKAVQTKARHLVSQNKRRYQEGGFDLDMTYITDSIIAMGFPGGDLSSGMLGYIEGFYRNHMEDIIHFLELHHKGKYKVYNLCSERLYDPSLLEGKVASFPFDDNNCPPLQLIKSFCQSAKSWLAGGLDNVVVVHCKAGMGRTGVMISSLLLYLKFFPTAEEAIAYFNGKRCTDGRALVLPSQIRYVKYFEKILREQDGEVPRSRKCILRGIRLHRCPYWIRPSIVVANHSGVLFASRRHPRTRDLMPEDIWHSAPRKGVVVFALPGEPCVADIGSDDFRIYLQDRHGDFFFWLNPNMVGSREFLTTSDLDWFDQRKLPAPGFQVEVVLLEGEARRPEAAPTTASSVPPAKSPTPAPSITPDRTPSSADASAPEKAASQTTPSKGEGGMAVERAAVRSAPEEGGDIFTDSEGEEDSKGGGKAAEPATPPVPSANPDPAPDASKPDQAMAAPATSAFGALANAMTGMGGNSFKGLSFMGLTMPGGFTGSTSPLPAGTPATPPQAPGSGAPASSQAVQPPSDTAVSSAKKPPAGAVREATGGPAANSESTATRQDSASPQVSGGGTSADVPVNTNAAAPASASVVTKSDLNAPAKSAESATATSSAAVPGPVSPTSDIKAIAAAAADSSVFSFGDEDDYLSD